MSRYVKASKVGWLEFLYMFTATLYALNVLYLSVFAISAIGGFSNKIL
jgi:hypothetical protein